MQVEAPSHLHNAWGRVNIRGGERRASRPALPFAPNLVCLHPLPPPGYLRMATPSNGHSGAVHAATPMLFYDQVN
jgi:hypothetical protein